MRESEVHPVTAFFSGIQSTLGRMAVVWVTLSLGLAIPFLPFFGREVVKALFFWPLGAVYGVVKWGGMPSVLPVGAVMIPAGLVLGVWGFITEHSPGVALWMVFSLSLLLTGPALLDDSVAAGWFWGILTGWILLSTGCLLAGRRRGT